MNSNSMSESRISDLQRQHAIDKTVDIVAGPQGMPAVVLRNERGDTANIMLHGAHVTHYQPHDQAPVLWMSQHSRFEAGQPIRGGIPVCWPWFGAHPTDPTLPAHGFARNLPWTLKKTSVLPHGEPCVRMTLSSSHATLQQWPHSFLAEVTVSLGNALTTALSVTNTGEQAFSYTSALHSYFNVSDIRSVIISGLENRCYLDTLVEERGQQQGRLRINSETDRIYFDTDDTCVIEDPLLNRRIHIIKDGSHSTVVWNPWSAKSQRMDDFGDDEFKGMVCIETARALDDSVKLAPGMRHTLKVLLQSESLR